MIASYNMIKHCKQCKAQMELRNDGLQDKDSKTWLKCPNCGTYHDIGKWPLSFMARTRFNKEEEKLKLATKKQSAIERVIAYSKSLDW